MTQDQLDVSLHGKHVGTLIPTRRGARFAYDQEIVREYAGMPLLSLSLPVKARPYAEGRTETWFRGLLPEGERLQAICQSIGCSEGDYVSILRHIGWECAGAVSVYDHDFEPPQDGLSRPLTQQALAQKLVDLPTYGGIDPLARVSLGGFQEKLLLVCHDLKVVDGYVVQANWWQPDAISISTHIVKPQPQGRFAGIVEGEAWAMAVAGCAARCARTALLQLSDAPLSLVVERYDREWHDGVCHRLHQEDCCQAMGIDPSGKYASYDVVRGSDPSYAKIASLLSTYAQEAREELAELLRQMVINVVLGNVDAHAKNYSLLLGQQSTPRLSPLYDVVPVTDVEPRAQYLSLRIGGKIALQDVGRAQVLEEARAWGISLHDAEHVLDEALDCIKAGMEQARELYPVAAARHEGGALVRMCTLLQG